MYKKALCFGLEPYPLPGYSVDHCPLIETVPLPFQIKKASYLLFTSKTAVDLCPLTEMPTIAIGKGTGARARAKGFNVTHIAEDETQEGICALLNQMRPSSVFWPRSDRARPILKNYCQLNSIELYDVSAYTILFKNVELPKLADYSALFFTSPSTVEAFFALIEKGRACDPAIRQSMTNQNPPPNRRIAGPALFPPGIELVSIGKVTEKYLIDRVSIYATLSSRLPAS